MISERRDTPRVAARIILVPPQARLEDENHEERESHQQRENERDKKKLQNSARGACARDERFGHVAAAISRSPPN